MSKKTTLLIIYCLLFTVCSSFAQVVYTDPNPNIIYYGSGNTTVSYNFDINHDSITDIEFQISIDWGESGVGLVPENSTAVVSAGSNADTLNINDTIGPNSNWSTASLTLAACFGGGPTGGLWTNVSNKFIGVCIIIGSDTLYGWVRLDVACATITIEDYAIDTIPNQPIIAGACIPSIVENLTISDVGNHKNGSDMNVSFERAIDETKVDEYRIIVVKDSEAASFNLDSAELVLSGNYYSVIPNGTNFSDTLHYNSRDKDGVLIKEFVPYKAFVLTIADTALAQNVLSDSSNVLTLTSPAAAATNVQVADTFLGSNIYNVKVSFDTIPNQSTISGYRIIFVKTSAGSSFNVDSASLIPSSGYYAIPPSGNNIRDSFSSDTLHDYQSNIIEHMVSYNAYVLSVADGTITNVNALSSPSANFTFSASSLAASNVLAEDVANTGNASDMRITCNKISDESTISGYRIIGVKLAECDSFNLSKANSVVTGSYIPVSCTGSNVSVQLPVSTRDKDGNPIASEIPYRFFILSVADNIHTDVNALSKESNIVALAIPNYFKAGQDTGAGVIYYGIVNDTMATNYVEGSNDNYSLDINNDGIPDFTLNAYYSGNLGLGMQEGSCSIEALGNNSICVVDKDRIDPDTMRFAGMINQDLYWNNGTQYFGEFTNSIVPNSDTKSGIWWDISVKYVGLRVISSTDTIYGWIKVYANPPYMIIYDYASYLRTSCSNITLTPPNPSICKGDSALIKASGATTYTWFPANGLSGTTGTSVHASPSSTTTYTVRGVDASGCNDSITITVKVDSCTGIHEISNNKNIIIYPNPATDILQIQTTLQIKSIDVLDITGRLLFTTTAKIIDCSGLSEGVYFIKATTEKGVVVKKFIKE